MPYQREQVSGDSLENDSILVLPEDDAWIDCVIAEVKRPKVEFNKSVRGPGGEERIAEALKMFGVLQAREFESGCKGYNLAMELHRAIKAREWEQFPSIQDTESRLSVRMIVFVPGTAKDADKRKHIDIQHVLDWTMKRMGLGVRCKPYRRVGMAGVSPWRGWTRLIVQVIDTNCWGPDGLSVDDFIDNVVRLQGGPSQSPT